MSIRKSASERTSMAADKIKGKSSSSSRRDLGKRSFTFREEEDTSIASTAKTSDPSDVKNHASSKLGKTVWKKLHGGLADKRHTTEQKEPEQLGDEKPTAAPKSDIMSRVREHPKDATKYNERLERARRFRRVDDMVPKEEELEEFEDTDDDEDGEYYDDAPRYIHFSVPRFKLLSFRRSKNKKDDSEENGATAVVPT